MSTKVLKDEALETYYQGLFEMYGMPGWRFLQEDYGRMRETHNSLAGLETEAQLWYRKGQLDMIEHLLSHQASVEHAYAALIAEQEGEAEVAPTGGVAKVVE